MEMRHLRAFLAVADELHFTRAARRLGVAQPAVSAAIRELEEELDARLFDRTRRRVGLTPAGEHFRVEAEQALAALERGARAARRAAAGEVGRVRLAFTALAALSPLPAAIARFRVERPDVQVEVAQRGTTDQIEDLHAGRIDLGFTVMPGEPPGLASRQITQEPLVAVLPSHHACAALDAVPIGAVASEPMLILPERSEPAMHRAYRRLCRQAGAEPRVAMELEPIDGVLGFVAAGLGVSLAPASIGALRMDGVVYVPLHPRIPAGVTALWHPATLPPAGAALLAIVASMGEAAALKGSTGRAP